MDFKFLYLILIHNDVKLVHPMLRMGVEIVTAVYVKSVIWMDAMRFGGCVRFLLYFVLLNPGLFTSAVKIMLTFRNLE